MVRNQAFRRELLVWFQLFFLDLWWYRRSWPFALRFWRFLRIFCSELFFLTWLISSVCRIYISFGHYLWLLFQEDCSLWIQLGLDFAKTVVFSNFSTENSDWTRVFQNWPCLVLQTFSESLRYHSQGLDSASSAKPLFVFRCCYYMRVLLWKLRRSSASFRSIETRFPLQ